jgi:hypothetical protein
MGFRRLAAVLGAGAAHIRALAEDGHLVAPWIGPTHSTAHLRITVRGDGTWDAEVGGPGECGDGQ